MADYNINLTIQNIWSIFRTLFDIGIMWLIIYYAMKFVKNNSRTIQIFKGIIIVLIVDGLAKIFRFTTVGYLTNLVISWGFLAIIIIFQPEIRGVLERLGKTNTFSKINTLLANEREELVDQVYQATIALSKSRTGALISIEKGQSLQDYIKTGIEINAKVSKELICSITFSSYFLPLPVLMFSSEAEMFLTLLSLTDFSKLEFLSLIYCTLNISLKSCKEL